MEIKVATGYCSRMSLASVMSRCYGWRLIAGLAVAWAGVTPGTAGYIMPAGQHKQLSPLLSQRPMDVYVATGPAGACGPGCSEWIAVEGKFDEGAGKRFREFVNSPRRRSLPVFFHSPGGALSAGIEIALVLREHQMTAGVGQTTQEGCTVQRVAGGTCDQRVKSGEDVASKLTFQNAQCHSACVFALAGGATRRIDRQRWSGSIRRKATSGPGSSSLTRTPG